MKGRPGTAEEGPSCYITNRFLLLIFRIVSQHNNQAVGASLDTSCFVMLILQHPKQDCGPSVEVETYRGQMMNSVLAKG